MIPRKLRIGPYTYDIVTSATELAYLQADDGEGLAGRFKELEQKIYINTELADTVVADSLLHETLHACIWVAGLRHIFKDESEEIVVNALSTTLLDTLRRNPKFVQALLTE